MSKLTVLVTDKIDPEGLKPLQNHPGIDLRYEIAPKPEALDGSWTPPAVTKGAIA